MFQGNTTTIGIITITTATTTTTVHTKGVSNNEANSSEYAITSG